MVLYLKLPNICNALLVHLIHFIILSRPLEAMIHNFRQTKDLCYLFAVLEKRGFDHVSKHSLPAEVERTVFLLCAKFGIE